MDSTNGKDPLVQVVEVVKSFPVGDGEITVLKGISFDIQKGEFVSIVGPSGNGKSTLLNMITGIDHPTDGQVIVTGTSAELGDNLSEVDATIEGDETEIAFNARYLIDALSVVGTSQTALETSTSSSPGLLRPVDGDDFSCVIMPMHITH